MYLGKLQKGPHKEGVCVRVVRKWTVKERLGDNQPLYVGLVLGDAQGDIMYAEIPRPTIEVNAHLLNVGGIYVISKFKIVNARPTYKPFDCHLMMELTDYTTVVPSTAAPNTFPKFVYSLTQFKDIIPATGAIVKFTDVIGYVTRYGAATSRIPRGKETVTILREVFIKDMSDNELKVTLWGDFATNFNVQNIYDEAAGNVVVVLFVGCMARQIYNTTYLSGGTAFDYYFNPEIPEAQPFYSRFQDQPLFIQRPLASEDQPPKQIQPTPLPHKTVAELNGIDPFEFTSTGYKCTVTVLAIDNPKTWWYMSCKPCKKKTEPQAGGGYRCPICLGSAAVPRYLLSLNAADETAEAVFFAYDDVATQIIQRECSSLLLSSRNEEGLPQKIAQIVSKKFVFSVGVTEESFNFKLRRKYLINSVLDRSDRRGSALHAVQADVALADAPPLLTPSTPSTLLVPPHAAQTPVSPPTIHGTPEKDSSMGSLLQKPESANLAPSTQVTAASAAALIQSPMDVPTTVRRKLFGSDAQTMKLVDSCQANTSTTSIELPSPQKTKRAKNSKSSPDNASSPVH